MRSKLRASTLLGAALSIMVFSAPAGQAQPADSMAGNAVPHERVVVYAPYVVTRKLVNPMMSKASAAGIEVVSASRTVSYADLNLSQASDQTTLEDRVHKAAQEACAEINQQYPKSIYTPIPQNQDCVGTAVNQAMVVVKDLEDAASIYGAIPR
jgi:UrcA family protein